MMSMFCLKFSIVAYCLYNKIQIPAKEIQDPLIHNVAGITF